MLSAAMLAFAVIAVQAATGAVWWAWVRRHASTSLIELLGMGLALGALGALLGAQATVALGLGGIGWALPSLIAAIVLVLNRLGRVHLGSPTRGSGAQWIAVAVSTLLGGLALIPTLLRTPLVNGYVVGSSYHGDLVFLEAVAQSVARLGPWDSTLLDGFPIRYHWFSYAWIGSLTEITGAGPFVVMTRVFPVVALIAVSLLAVAWARRLSTRTWTPLLAAVLVVVGGHVGAEQGVILNLDSPSTAFAAMLGLAFAVALSELLGTWQSGPGARWSALAVLTILAAGTVGAKASQAAVLALGVACAAIIALRWPPGVRRRAWLTLLASALAMLVAYLFLLAGVSGSETNIAIDLFGQHVSTYQGLDPSATPVGVLLGSLVFTLAVLPRWMGAAWLLGDARTRWAPETAFGVGVALAGLLPILLLSSGTNAGWFAVAASPILAVLSAVGLERAWASVARQSGARPAWWRHPVVIVVAAAVLINVVVFAAYALAVVSGAPVLWRGPVSAWIFAALLALGPMRAFDRRAGAARRWAVTLTAILVLTSIGARFSSSALWAVSHSRLTPAVQDFVRWWDPTAEFATAPHPGTAPVPTRSGAVRAVGAAATVPASASDGVARVADMIQWSPELDHAARWLEPQVEPGTLVALDATYFQPFLPVMTNLSMYVAGEPYTSGYTTKDGAEAINEREARVRDFLDNPSPEAANALWDDGVRWLWLRTTPAAQIARADPWATAVLSDPQVTILRLSDPGASSSSRP